MRKYVAFLSLLIAAYTIVLTEPLLVVRFYTPSSSEDINDTDSGGYRYFVLKEPNIALKLGIRANEVYKNDYINGAFQIRAYHELGAHYDKGYNEYYDVIYQNDNFSVKLFDPKTMEIPLNIKIKDYPFAKIRVFYRNFEYNNHLVFEEVDYNGYYPIIITDNRENYNKHMQKIRETQEKERIKNSTINQQTITDDRIKQPLGYASIVDTLRIRETPSLQGKIVGSLKRFQTAEWLREESKNADTIPVKGQPVEERWVKVRTLDGAVTGWVWKGFVRQVKKVIVKEMGLSFYEICDGVYNDDDLIPKESMYYNETINSSGKYTVFGIYEDTPFTFDMPNEDLMQTIDNKEYIVNLVINETGKMEIPLFEGVLESYADATTPLAVVCSYSYSNSQFSVFIVSRQHHITIRYSKPPGTIVNEKIFTELRSGTAPEILQRNYDDIMIIKNSIEKVRE